MSEQGPRINRKDTPGGIITARAYKYAESFYAFADGKFPELKGYPPENARCTLLQAAIIVSSLIMLERRNQGAGWFDLHTSVVHAFAPSVRERHLAAINDLYCCLLTMDRNGPKTIAIPSFCDLATIPDAKLVKEIGLWLGHGIAKKKVLEPADLAIAAALGRSAWTSATMIARMLGAK